MPYYQRPDNLNKIRIVSPLIVLISLIQFGMIFFLKYVTRIDNTSGYVVNFFYPIIFVTSAALVVTAINNIRKKTIGLIDLVLVCIVLLVSYVLFTS